MFVDLSKCLLKVALLSVSAISPCSSFQALISFFFFLICLVNLPFSEIFLKFPPLILYPWYLLFGPCMLLGGVGRDGDILWHSVTFFNHRMCLWFPEFSSHVYVWSAIYNVVHRWMNLMECDWRPKLSPSYIYICYQDNPWPPKLGEIKLFCATLNLIFSNSGNVRVNL